MEHETGELVFRVVLPEWIDDDSARISNFYTDRLKHDLTGNMHASTAYFVWVDEPQWYRYDSGHEFYYEMPNRFYDDSEVLVEIKALLLLIDWSRCEVGEATIGRPEWNLPMFVGIIATVEGPDGKTWCFQRERNNTRADYAEIWRRIR